MNSQKVQIRRQSKKLQVQGGQVRHTTSGQLRHTDNAKGKRGTHQVMIRRRMSSHPPCYPSENEMHFKTHQISLSDRYIEEFITIDTVVIIADRNWREKIYLKHLVFVNK